MNSSSLSKISRILVLLCVILLISVLYLPIWEIQLDAPQYPEGLTLKIHASDIKGDVEIINGLNHYIGMKTLHKEDFIEFTILPYCILLFAFLFLLVFFLNKRLYFYISIFLFLLFGLLAIIDFWRWEFNYGHDLDPNAAIQVPGMSYQPPLIGFKQLLNFGAYSIPDIGGWIFILVGFILLIVLLIEVKSITNSKKSIKIISLIFIVSIYSCNNIVEPIHIGKDTCQFCKMLLVDSRFGAAIYSKKGRTYKFDDISCLLNFIKETSSVKREVDEIYITDYLGEHKLWPAENLSFLVSDEFRTPMKSNTAGFSNMDSAQIISIKNMGALKKWVEIYN